MKKTIDFIGIGCQKCGTTSVFNALAQHFFIIPPNGAISGANLSIEETKRLQLASKECHYWGRDIRVFGIETYHKQYWQDFFVNGKFIEDFVYGEFTPNYIIFEDALKRIKEYNPDIKLLAIFRNPVERLWSEYTMFISYGRYNISFRELIDKYSDLREPRVKRRTKTETWPIYRSCYGKQVKRVLDLFDRKNVFFLKMDELKKFSATIERIFSFLGVSPISVPELKLNKRDNPQEKIPYYEELMDRFFLKDIELLEDLLGWNCDEWKRCF